MCNKALNDFDVRSNSPFVSLLNTWQFGLEGESSSLSEVTYGFIPGTPSTVKQLEVARHKLKYLDKFSSTVKTACCV